MEFIKKKQEKKDPTHRVTLKSLDSTPCPTCVEN
jgi:hypothetical protein